MTFPATARAANIKDSWKKYFNDNLRSDSIYVSFDANLVQPKTQGRPMEKWVSIVLGQYINKPLASQVVEIFCCTRRDSEGFKCAQLRDTVMALITDSDDKFKRIPLYQSTASPSATWTTIGQINIPRDEIIEAKEGELPDNGKLRTLTLITRFASGF